ncbi:MAG: hypothetical protein ISP49_17485 [Reyranella sp.]|nr:hypothetical protein [Reyranella sp.]MBL6653394.1 hypothetical protein [Reyranella sp.]
MRVLALLLVLVSMPVLAATNYTPWPDREEQASVTELAQPVTELAQAQGQRQGQGQGQGPGQGQDSGSGSRSNGSLSGGDYPGRYCCFHCRANEIPCGGECIPAKLNGKQAMCKKVAGCACAGKP